MQPEDVTVYLSVRLAGAEAYLLDRYVSHDRHR
jgi:hypothetical protein